MVVETTEQMQLTDFEAMFKQLSEVKKRCKSSHFRLRLCEPSFILLTERRIHQQCMYMWVKAFNAPLCYCQC